MPFTAKVLMTTTSSVLGLAELLGQVKLADKLSDADRWCQELGANEIADLAGYEMAFVEHLQLKPIPKSKLLNALASLGSQSLPPTASTPKTIAAERQGGGEGSAVVKPNDDLIDAFFKKVGSSLEKVKGATTLDWGSKGLNDDDCKVIAWLVCSGALGGLTKLSLSYNQIGDAGMIAFSEALKPNSNFPMGALGCPATHTFYSKPWFGSLCKHCGHKKEEHQPRSGSGSMGGLTV